MNSFSAQHYVTRVELRREKVPSFDFYPFSLAAIRHLKTLELHPRVTFIIGENGSGKSTLLEAIAVAWGFNRRRRHQELPVSDPQVPLAPA